MALRRVTISPSGAPGDVLHRAFDDIRTELEVPGEFPAEALAEADAAAAAAPDRDARDLDFVTIDPPGSMDLDQAMCLTREGTGYRVRYAIADVPGFVLPEGALAAEALRRGVTYYLPDERAPLWPTTLSEGKASLLPDQDRPAYVWDLVVDARGEVTSCEVNRALVRSRAKLDYESVQRDVDAGTAPEGLMLLKEIGELRVRLEHERGGASLPKPEQQVVKKGEGQDATYELAFRPLLPSEDWNAQISLMTGMAAADMMLHGEIGILRTMPPAQPGEIATFRRKASALGITWPAEMLYGDFLRTLDRTNPKHLALINAATRLFRGAGYTPFDGAVPELIEHSAIAAPYAHVTAPLRRLVDRFGLVTCASLSSGQAVPEWVRAALPMLPEIMKDADRRASAVDRACADAVEAAVLASHVGQEFDAVVIDQRGDKGLVVQLTDPAVEAACDGSAGLGDVVRVRLVVADPVKRQVRFAVAG